VAMLAKPVTRGVLGEEFATSAPLRWEPLRLSFLVSHAAR
jgi:hypothetical protein